MHLPSELALGNPTQDFVNAQSLNPKQCLGACGVWPSGIGGFTRWGIADVS